MYRIHFPEPLLFNKWATEEKLQLLGVKRREPADTDWKLSSITFLSDLNSAQMQEQFLNFDEKFPGQVCFIECIWEVAYRNLPFEEEWSATNDQTTLGFKNEEAPPPSPDPVRPDGAPPSNAH